jgi:hypothetical protein
MEKHGGAAQTEIDHRPPALYPPDSPSFPISWLNFLARVSLLEGLARPRSMCGDWKGSEELSGLDEEDEGDEGD